MWIWVLTLVGLSAIAWCMEYRTWNGGVCKHNGEDWVIFDVDSQGGRGYRAGDIYCWISWPELRG